MYCDRERERGAADPCGDVVCERARAELQFRLHVDVDGRAERGSLDVDSPAHTVIIVHV